MSAKSLKAFLDEKGVKYTSVLHSEAFTAQEIAASAHVSGKILAKTVIVDLDGRLAMAVLPANQRVVLQDLRDITGSEHVKFATEEQFKARFPDCETGAMPPFGQLYEMDVYVADSLANSEEIAFNAGSHVEVIKMAYRDFERLTNPRVVNFTS